MNWYAFHLGDYLSHTRHLSPMEDLAYRRMLDWYYLHERPFNGRSTDVARLIGLPDHEPEVEAVLREFFEQVEGRGWVNRRADEEIASYAARRKSASEAGKRSANKRSTTVQRPLSDGSTTVQLTTTTPTTTPIQNTKPARARVSNVSCPEEVKPEIWEGWISIRKAKRAPISEAALDLVRAEATKAGWTLNAALTECVARGWQGFKADWVAAKAAQSFGMRPAKPLAHIVNMPLGTPSCDCEDCVSYRAKRMVAP